MDAARPARRLLASRAAWLALLEAASRVDQVRGAPRAPTPRRPA